MTNLDEYLKMGEVHTSKDRTITRRELIEIERNLNGHITMWCKIWGTGKGHKQLGRVVDSKRNSSEEVADMYLLVKDHKETLQTRPVVTGCKSNTKGLSNAASDVVESVSGRKY